MAVPARMSLEDVGRQLLGDVEEMSLEEVLLRIRAEADAHRGQYDGPNVADVPRRARQVAGVTTQSPATASLHLHSFHIPELQQVVARHFHATRSPELVVGGSRPLALVYFLVAALIATHSYAVVVVDVEARFDTGRLLGMRPVVYGGLPMSAVCEADLQHIHVFRTDPRWCTSLRELVTTAEQRALYSMQRRRDRPLWGTITVGSTASIAGLSAVADTETGPTPVVGASLSHGAGAALATGYYGWLRVDALGQKEELEKFTQTREQRLAALFSDMESDESERLPCKATAPDQVALVHVTWAAISSWGGFAFGLSGTS